MRNLVIAPTATYKRQGDRVQVNDTIKDYADFVVLKQKMGKPLVPAGTNKTGTVVQQKTYVDMQPIHHEIQHNRERALNVFEMDTLYDYRPLYGVSFPDMKLRQKDITGY